MAVARERLPQTSVAPSVAERRTIPIKWWAGLGIAVLAFQAWIMLRWVTGPFFESVDPGPTEVPSWMKVCLVFWQAALPLLGLGVLYWFVVRPWRRERAVGVDGLLALAFATLWFQDPLSAYGDHWYTYNAWQLNMGSWVNSIPGWGSYGTPDHQVAFPLLVVPGAYITVFMLVSIMGAKLMRTVKERRPQIGKLGLVAICFAFMAPFDLVFEGLIFMPMGAWEYPGGHWAIFPSTYHKYPLNEALTTGALFTAFASVKYFTNDRGQSVAERGLEEIKGSPSRTFALRALAMTGLINCVMLACYNVPNYWFGMHSTEWPADTQQRSYLTYTCGEATGYACPGPDVPHIRNDNTAEGKGSAYLRFDHRLGVPPNTKLPEVVPYER